LNGLFRKTMDNYRFIKKLRETLLDEAASGLTDEEVEEFMSGPVNSAAAGALEDMRRGFAVKALCSLHPEPIRLVRKGETLGRWIAGTRKKAGLSVGFVATALGTPSSLVERLETGETLPWSLAAPQAADLLILFRLHFSAFKDLIKTTGDLIADAGAIRGEMGSEQSQSEAPSTLPPVEHPAVEESGWMKEVRRSLEEKNAQQFLD
jgi:hypothetical protein